MKIAIVVHGRFHAFDLARELLRRGHDVTVFTNYPGWAAARFGVPAARVRSFWGHGLLARLRDRCGWPSEPMLHTLFGRWAARQVPREPWDIVHCWSGVSEELLQALAGSATPTLLLRGSSHIRVQAQILEEESRRVGRPVSCPSPWMVAREEREYLLAWRIVVLSRFAEESFRRAGVPAARVRRLSLGTRRATFRPAPEVIERRCQRLLRGEPLQVLYLGALSFRKGLWDLLAVSRGLPRESFRLRCVGPVLAEGRPLLAALRHTAEWVPAQPQQTLPAWYADADLFLFPTLEDGYAVVLDQALAGGLPVLTTTHCAGPDVIREGATGWVVPIRSPDALLTRLRWAHAHRAELAAMVRRLYDTFQPRDWADVAADYEALCLQELAGTA